MTANSMAIKLLLPAALCAAILSLLTSCGRSLITKGDVYERMSRELPIGTPRREATEYLNKLEIKGWKATVFDYLKYEAPEPFVRDGRESKIMGHVMACFKGAGAGFIPRLDSTCTILYFDEEGRLINYQIDYFRRS